MKGLRVAIFLAIGYITSFNGYSQEVDSLDIKIGQMVMIGIGSIDEYDSTDRLVKYIEDGYVGGIVLYEKNILRKNPKPALKNLVCNYQTKPNIPLFISIDEEGGRVNRLKTKYGFLPTISAAKMARLNNTDSVSHYISNIVSNMYEVGINLNYAPDVDLAVNPYNPVIAKVERSYGLDPAEVSKYAMEIVKQHRLMGIGTVLKHFPGHGSSKSDTHLGIADVTNYWRFEELRPYKMMLDSGMVDAVMTAHIVNANLDHRKYPSTLSDKVVTGILRDFLNYEGVVFSDDMQMMAISDHYGFENAVKLAILAGVDVLMFANNVPGSENVTVKDLHGMIRKLVDSGEISESSINESYNRILKMKSDLGLLSPNYLEQLQKRLLDN